jgi:hypothetical protein
MKKNKLKLGWFTTSRGKTSLKIFKYIYSAIENKELNIELKFVFVKASKVKLIRSPILTKLVSVLTVILTLSPANKL